MLLTLDNLVSLSNNWNKVSGCKHGGLCQIRPQRPCLAFHVLSTALSANFKCFRYVFFCLKFTGCNRDVQLAYQVLQAVFFRCPICAFRRSEIGSIGIGRHGPLLALHKPQQPPVPGRAPRRETDLVFRRLGPLWVGSAKTPGALRGRATPDSRFILEGFLGVHRGTGVWVGVSLL